MLGRLLKYSINDLSNQDVHDRALFYHRLLSTDVNTTALMFKNTCENNNSAEGLDRTSYFENSAAEIRDLVFLEFNSLSVIYGLPSSQFIDEVFQKVIVFVFVFDFDFN